jgi:hypothetical protein
MNHNLIYQITVAILAMNLSSCSLNAITSLASTPSRFGFCKNCDGAKYYIGYNRTNSVNIGSQKAAFPAKADTILQNRIKLNVPNVDEQKVDRKDGNFISAVHRIEALRIGTSEKSELMTINTKEGNAAAKATVKLMWGDTFNVTSKTLASGTLIKVNLKRTIGGFGNPVTDHAYYHAISKTLLNGQAISQLNYTLEKQPGVGQKDQSTGKNDSTYVFNTKIGETFTVEALQEVTDGVNSHPSAPQKLNGADSVEYEVALANPSSACLNSSSGTFRTGTCGY